AKRSSDADEVTSEPLFARVPLPEADTPAVTGFVWRTPAYSVARRSTNTAAWSNVTLTWLAPAAATLEAYQIAWLSPLPRAVATPGWYVLPALSVTETTFATVSFQPIATMFVLPAVCAAANTAPTLACGVCGTAEVCCTKLGAVASVVTTSGADCAEGLPA